MLLIAGTTDLIRVVTTTAATLDCNVDAIEIDNSTPPVVQKTYDQQTKISSATTTTILSAPAANRYQNVKNITIYNTHASLSDVVTVQYYDGSNSSNLWNGTLLAGEMVVFDETGVWTLYDVTGVQKPSNAYTNPNNASTTSQAPTAGTDTILTGSTITIPPSKIKIGTRFRFIFSVAKTAVGTVASTFTFRLGTNGGTTADTAICAFSTGTATAAADVGLFVIDVVCRGPLSASAVFQGHLSLTHNLATTGWSTTGVGVQTTSSAFDITQANLTASVSFNGGTSLVSTFQLVAVETFNL